MVCLRKEDYSKAARVVDFLARYPKRDLITFGYTFSALLTKRGFSVNSLLIASTQLHFE
jgi:hypothetical protein